MLFTSQNCPWATSGHHHNVVINKSISRDSVYIYVIYTYICIYTHTYLSVIIHTDGGRKATAQGNIETEPLQLLF